MNASLATSIELLSSMSDSNSASDLKPTLRVVNEEFLKGSDVISDKLSELQNKIDCEKQFEVFNVNQRAQFSISSPDRKRGLTSIIENLKIQRTLMNDTTHFQKEDFYTFGDTSTPETLDTSPQTPITKPQRHRRRPERSVLQNGQTPTTTTPLPSDYAAHNNNNHVKNERLSPGTPDTSSRSRSVTPSSASHPDTPPAPENPVFSLQGRNYSDFMRSLAAKYNNANPNDFFGAARNGFPPPLDPRLKQPSFPSILPHIPSNVPAPNKDELPKKPEFNHLLNPFTGAPMFPPVIDMSSTQTLIALVRTAKEAELQGLLKSTKRQDTSSPLDLSAAAPPMKRPKLKANSGSSQSGLCAPQKRPESTSPRLQEDISCWTVDDVCNFVSSIDICAEYAQSFRDQRIDGTGLPLLTEEHLTSTINMKLGPALKLKSILTKKFGSCNVCLHCSHCHNSSSGSPDPGNATGNTSDSGGTS